MTTCKLKLLRKQCMFITTIYGVVCPPSNSYTCITFPTFINYIYAFQKIKKIAHDTFINHVTLFRQNLTNRGKFK